MKIYNIICSLVLRRGFLIRCAIPVISLYCKRLKSISAKLIAYMRAATFAPSNICFYYSLLTKLFHNAATITFSWIHFRRFLKNGKKKFRQSFSEKIIFIGISFVLRIIWNAYICAKKIGIHFFLHTFQNIQACFG